MQWQGKKKTNRRNERAELPKREESTTDKEKRARRLKNEHCLVLNQKVNLCLGCTTFNLQVGAHTKGLLPHLIGEKWIYKSPFIAQSGL